MTAAFVLAATISTSGLGTFTIPPDGMPSAIPSRFIPGGLGTGRGGEVLRMSRFRWGAAMSQCDAVMEREELLCNFGAWAKGYSAAQWQAMPYCRAILGWGTNETRRAYSPFNMNRISFERSRAVRDWVRNNVQYLTGSYLASRVGGFDVPVSSSQWIYDGSISNSLSASSWRNVFPMWGDLRGDGSLVDDAWQTRHGFPLGTFAADALAFHGTNIVRLVEEQAGILGGLFCSDPGSGGEYSVAAFVGDWLGDDDLALTNLAQFAENDSLKFLHGREAVTDFALANMDMMYHKQIDGKYLYCNHVATNKTLTVRQAIPVTVSLADTNETASTVRTVRLTVAGSDDNPQVTEKYDGGKVSPMAYGFAKSYDVTIGAVGNLNTSALWVDAADAWDALAYTGFEEWYVASLELDGAGQWFLLLAPADSSHSSESAIGPLTIDAPSGTGAVSVVSSAYAEWTPEGALDKGGTAYPSNLWTRVAGWRRWELEGLVAAPCEDLNATPDGTPELDYDSALAAARQSSKSWMDVDKVRRGLRLNPAADGEVMRSYRVYADSAATAANQRARDVETLFPEFSGRALDPAAWMMDAADIAATVAATNFTASLVFNPLWGRMMATSAGEVVCVSPDGSYCATNSASGGGRLSMGSIAWELSGTVGIATTNGAYHVQICPSVFDAQILRCDNLTIEESE